MWINLMLVLGHQDRTKTQNNVIRFNKCRLMNHLQSLCSKVRVNEKFVAENRMCKWEWNALNNVNSRVLYYSLSLSLLGSILKENTT